MRYRTAASSVLGVLRGRGGGQLEGIESRETCSPCAGGRLHGVRTVRVGHEGHKYGDLLQWSSPWYRGEHRIDGHIVTGAAPLQGNRNGRTGGMLPNREPRVNFYWT